MKQIFAMLSAVALFIVAVATDAGAVELRSHAVVDGDQVRLGDLFDGLPPHQAAIAIARTPVAGREVTLDAGWLVRVARAYGVDYRPASLHAEVTIARATNQVSGDAIVAAATAAVSDRLPPFGEPSIEFDRLPADVRIAVEVPETVAVTDVDYDRQTGRFTAVAMIPAEGSAVATVPIAGRAVAMVEIPVLNRRLRDGQEITGDDIDWLTVNGATLAEGTAQTVDELVGLALRRPLSARSAVRLSDLRQPTVVGRGDSVDILYSSDALTIVGRGRALDSGAPGDVVRVLNIDSNRTIEGVVASPGLVRIQIGLRLASAG